MDYEVTFHIDALTSEEYEAQAIRHRKTMVDRILVETRIYSDVDYFSERNYYAQYKYHHGLKKWVRTFMWVRHTIKRDKNGRLTVYVSGPFGVRNMTWGEHFYNRQAIELAWQMMVERKPALSVFASPLDFAEPEFICVMYKNVDPVAELNSLPNRAVKRYFGSVTGRMTYLRWEAAVRAFNAGARFFPSEWVLEYARTQEDLASLYCFQNHLDDLIRLVGGSLRRAFTILVEGQGRDVAFLATDILHMVERRELVVLPRFRTYEDIQLFHDDLATVTRMEYARSPSGPIEQTVEALLVDGVEVKPDLVVRTAKDVNDMFAWGAYMSNCIAAYVGPAQRGEALYLGIYRGDELIANVEIRDGALIQCLGKYNQSLDPDLFNAVESALRGATVVTKDYNTWGRGV